MKALFSLFFISLVVSMPCFGKENIQIKYSRVELVYYVNENAKNLPIKTDAFTTVTSVLLLGRSTVLWRYTLDIQTLMEVLEPAKKDPSIVISLDKFRKTLTPALKQGVIQKNCNTPAIRKFIDGGVYIKHSYFDTNGNFFMEVTVGKQKCIQNI